MSVVQAELPGKLGLTKMIVLIIEYEVPVENRPEFLARMAESCRTTILDEGCMRMEFCQPVEGENGTYFLTELWRDQESIDKHRERPGHAEVHEKINALLTMKRFSKLHSFAVDQ